jgi:hypothetical protein
VTENATFHIHEVSLFLSIENFENFCFSSCFVFSSLNKLLLFWSVVSFGSDKRSFKFCLVFVHNFLNECTKWDQVIHRKRKSRTRSWNFKNLGNKFGYYEKDVSELLLKEPLIEKNQNPRFIKFLLRFFFINNNFHGWFRQSKSGKIF